ncbi:MAG TPA: hypothetical protein PKI76_02305 [Oscillospiraceae bacterium]|nr:hypothetical protein [Oscillospiraceae bacterium]HNW04202.1 hypothetical protein [Oscillospiraceae bacterium]
MNDISETPKSCRLYVVFTSTPYRIGRLIRVVTKNPYNHVSISLDGGLDGMYSYARHYKNTPFYGGFVREYSDRYRKEFGDTKVKICALPVTEEQYRRTEERLARMTAESDRYPYNLISAFCVPFHRRFLAEGSFTCSEFALDVLSTVDERFDGRKFYTIREMEQKLDAGKVYEGDYPEPAAGCDDDFEAKQTALFYASHAARNVALMLKCRFRWRRRRGGAPGPDKR